MWNPEQYRRYRDERSRPFFELLAQVDAPDARTIADLGCGPGELTATLLERWPNARIYGVDNSAEMLAAAAQFAIPGRLSFELADAATWQPPAPLDLLISNATLHWLPNHDTLLPRLVSLLAPHGVFAFQVPGNFDQPSHTILKQIRTSPRWAAKVGWGADRSAASQSPAWYFELLTGLGMKVNAWETTYLHVLQGEDAVLEWAKGTALRPVVAVLNAEEQAEFTVEYAARLREAYPHREYGTLLPFRRIFVVASK
ncbi:MAG: trans-aconitate 2-methyltransferase [Candidatus Chloroheliales bacterium]|nr:MAG: trans-aconitate 2-methyltransferase [Chloroflexota bacterium]